jgi:hypothetical protein
MGTPHGSSCEAVNDCSTPIAFAGNTGSTPGASRTSGDFADSLAVFFTGHNFCHASENIRCTALAGEE